MEDLRNLQDRRVYVGNLPFSVDWSRLKDFMRQAGEVVHSNVLTTPSGMSRGSGVVEFATAEDAKHAIETLNNQVIEGRQIYVREDREPARPTDGPSGSGSGGRGQQFPGRSQPGFGRCSVYFGNLPFSVSWQDLKDVARSAGPVVRADVRLSYNGRSRGYGTVVYENEEHAKLAIATLNGKEIEGRKIEVREDRPYNERAARPDVLSPGGVSGSPAAGAGGLAVPKAPRFSSPDSFAAASGHGEPSNIIHVSNLPWQTTNNDLVELFQTIGQVSRAEIQLLPDGRASGNGVVQFLIPESAHLAITQFNGYTYGGLNIVVTYARYPPLTGPSA